METLLTVIETCRQQYRNVFAHITAALQARFHRHPGPLPPGVCYGSGVLFLARPECLFHFRNDPSTYIFLVLAFILPKFFCDVVLYLLCAVDAKGHGLTNQAPLACVWFAIPPFFCLRYCACSNRVQPFLVVSVYTVRRSLRLCELSCLSDKRLDRLWMPDDYPKRCGNKPALAQEFAKLSPLKFAWIPVPSGM